MMSSIRVSAGNGEYAASAAYGAACLPLMGYGQINDGLNLITHHSAKR